MKLGQKSAINDLRRLAPVTDATDNSSTSTGSGGRFWEIDGNVEGADLLGGTLDAYNVELHTNGTRVARYSKDKNLTLGSATHLLDEFGYNANNAIIGGTDNSLQGGTALSPQRYTTIIGGRICTITRSSYALIAAADTCDILDSNYGIILGGDGNLINSAPYALVAGRNTVATHQYAFVHSLSSSGLRSAAAGQWSALAPNGFRFVLTVDGSKDPQTLVEINSNACVVLHDQQTAANAARGIIFKDGNTFLHNYRHPTGNTARPSGYNTFVGLAAGNLSMGATATSVLHASYNVGVGHLACYALSIGSRNVGMGYRALRLNSTGNSNTGIGHEALYATASTSNNAALGAYALYQNIAHRNTAVGADALTEITSGGDNAALGYLAGAYIVTSGDNNQTTQQSVYIGASTEASADGVTNEIAIGYNAAGMGSNTSVLGSTAVTAAHIRGALTFGSGAAGVDYALTADGETNDGSITWMEDEDYWRFEDDTLHNSDERAHFRDTDIGVYSQADGYLDAHADSGVRIGDSSAGAPTNYAQFASNGLLTFHGAAQNFLPPGRDFDFTGTDFDTKAECQALGLRFSDSDTPFPTALIWTLSGSWSHVAGRGWQPAAPTDGQGPGLLLPLARPGNWELEVTVDYDPVGDPDRGIMRFGYIANSNHFGAAASFADGSALLSTPFADLLSNNGDDTITNRYTGSALPSGSASYTIAFRCQNGAIGVYDPQDSAWHWYEGRQSTGIAYTAAHAFLQFWKASGATFWRVYVASLKLTYLT